VLSGQDQAPEAEHANGVFGAEFKPLTADEARQWRAANPAASPWWVVLWQVFAGAVFAVAAGWVSGSSSGVSAAYGAAAVVLPAALMVRGLRRQVGLAQANAALVGFMVWELVKIALTVAMLILAPKLIQPLNWLALVAGFVVTMKVYWVAAWLHSRRRNLNVSN
jgi:ATP synthase protein I